MITRADILPVSCCGRASRLRADDFEQTVWQYINDGILHDINCIGIGDCNARGGKGAMMFTPV
eukprot:SAG31_NODE_21022_length_559_cov_1.265217_1_plen_62_part_10